MKIDAHVSRGPDFDGCLDYCHHEKDMGQKAIMWTDDDGKEYGMAMSFKLPLDDVFESYLDKALFHQYDLWLAREGKD